MGGVCARNEAGRVATDAPVRGKPEAKQLESGGMPVSQQPAKPVTKLIPAGKHFATEVGNDEKEQLDAFAQQTADEYCQANPGWKYTGKWQDSKDGDAPISLFEVEQVIAQENKALAAVTAKVQQDVKNAQQEDGNVAPVNNAEPDGNPVTDKMAEALKERLKEEVDAGRAHLKEEEDKEEKKDEPKEEAKEEKVANEDEDKKDEEEKKDEEKKEEAPDADAPKDKQDDKADGDKNDTDGIADDLGT